MTQQNALDQWFTVKQVAEKLQVHENYIRKIIREKKLRAANLGGRGGYRISQEALQQYLDELSKRAA